MGRKDFPRYHPIFRICELSASNNEPEPENFHSQLKSNLPCSTHKRFSALNALSAVLLIKYSSFSSSFTY